MPRRIEKSPFERAALEGKTTGAAPLTPTCSNESSIVKGPNAPKNGEWIDRFLTEIMEGASVTAATNAAGVHITLPYKRRVDDEAFRRAWKEAADIGTELMEQEAARRAYHGTLKPVFHKGVECGYVREYSDVLMIFLLKARNPAKYRDMMEQGKAPTVNVSVQTNIAAVELLNRMLDDPLRSLEDSTALDIAGTPGDSGHGGQVGAGAAPESDQPGAGEGVADPQQ